MVKNFKKKMLLLVNKLNFSSIVIIIVEVFSNLLTKNQLYQNSNVPTTKIINNHTYKNIFLICNIKFIYIYNIFWNIGTI